MHGLGQSNTIEKCGFRWLDSGQDGFREVDSLDSKKESSTPRS
jgi:hypothetical protein